MRINLEVGFDISVFVCNKNSVERKRVKLYFTYYLYGPSGSGCSLNFRNIFFICVGNGNTLFFLLLLSLIIIIKSYNFIYLYIYIYIYILTCFI